jgi:cytochrome c oxidase assembly protein Cox11
MRRLMPLLIAGALVGSGLTLVAFSVPLYRMFCAATGYGGQTVRADRNTTVMSERRITVRFSTDVAPGLDWRFVPEQRQVSVRLGEQALVYFRAENRSQERIVGHAAFNVAPFKAGPYFNKIQCFCFDEEALEPGETVEMPVVFFVDPALAENPDTTELETITLAYTFFRSARPEAAAELSRFATSFAGDGPADPAHGKAVFESRCAACHALGADRTGPRLAGVMGRTAGTVASFASYSPALEGANVIWSKDTLDRWLTDPGAFIPGARMPLHLASPIDRRDVIEFLAEAGKQAAR